MAKSTRKFGGKLYYLEAVAWSKREAQNRAKQFRKDGFLARIVKSTEADKFAATGDGWAVYTRVDHSKQHHSGIVPTQRSIYRMGR